MRQDNLTSLLVRWEEALDLGQDLTPEQVCADRPDLVDAFRECVQAVLHIRNLRMAPKQPSTPLRGDRQLDPGVVGIDADGPAGYEILEVLGRGGMGVVYKARQAALNRIVALKMILSGAHAGDDERDRFLAEAEAIARIRHPGIVQVFDFGTAGGLPFFSLELCDGGSLAARLAGTPLRPRVAAEVVEQVARAAQAAHSAGIVHRDLKPGNVLLSGGAPTGAPAGEPGEAAWWHGAVAKVSDFGLAKRVEGGGKTQTGDVIGTPSYMAPEQASGRKDVGPLADVYAVGAILYECLTGRPPFLASTSVEILLQVIADEPIPPSRLNPSVPPDIQTICLKCLHKDPARRYPSAGDLADDLARFRAGEPVRARPIGFPERCLRWCLRHKALATLYGVSGTAAVLLIGGGIWFTSRLAEERIRVAEEQFSRQQADTDAKASSERAGAAEKLEKTHRYFALLNRAGEQIARPQPGWTWKAMEDLTGAAALDNQRGHLDLRSRAALCLAAPDVRLQQTFPDTRNLRALAWHPGGNVLAAAGFGEGGVVGLHVVHLLDCRRPTARRRLTCMKVPVLDGFVTRPDMINGLAFSPDGRWLMAVTRSGRLHYWDLNQERPKVQTVVADRSPLMWALFSPDGKAAYTASDRTLRRWDTAVWKQTASWEEQGRGGAPALLGTCGAIHPTEGWIAVRFPGGVHRLHPDTLRPVGHHLVGQGLGLSPVLSPDGRILLVPADAEVRAYDTMGDRLVQVLRGPNEEHSHNHPIDTFALSPDGTLLVSGSGNAREVRVWDLVAARLIYRLPTGHGEAAVAFSPDGRSFSIAVSDSTQVYEVRRRVQTFVGPCPSVIQNFATAGSSVACITEAELASRGEVVMWKGLDGPIPATRQHIRGHDSLPYPLTARNGCRQIAVSGLPSEEIIVYDAAGGFERLVDGVKGSRALAFAPNGLLWEGTDEEVRAWETPALKQVARWKNTFGTALRGSAGINAVAAGNRWVVAAGAEGDVRTFPARKGDLSPASQENLCRAGLTTAALAPDETLALLGADTGGVWLVRVPGCEVLEEFPSMGGRIEALSWSATDLVAAGCRDGLIKLWRREGDRLVELLSLRHDRPVRQLHFTADGLRLGVLLQGERAVRMWRLDLLREELKPLGPAGELGVIRGLPVPAVEWVPPTVPTVNPSSPNGLKAELFRGIDLRGLVHIRHDPNIDFDWGEKAASPELWPDGFSIRWTGWLRAPRPGRYILAVQADDVARLWLDGKLCAEVRKHTGVNRWVAEVALGDRPHQLKLKYAEDNGRAFVRLLWSLAGGFSERVVPTEALFHDRKAAEKARVEIPGLK